MTGITQVWTPDNTGGLVVAEAYRFMEMRWAIASRLLQAPTFNAGKWQQLDVSGSSAHDTHELFNIALWYDMPSDLDGAQLAINPDMPWAEEHFQERVAGKAVNPGDWHDKWPYHQGKVDLHQHGGKYDHNYMERYWPTNLEFDITQTTVGGADFIGYRFPVGDLNDVVSLLFREPGTRQAYLPVWFPEDTGATEGQRVPCTLGYHFIIRDGFLNMTYNMRTCEIYRHFTNDVYMAVRLAHWVVNQLNRLEAVSEDPRPFIEPGQLTMNIANLHAFVGDTENIERFQNP